MTSTNRPVPSAVTLAAALFAAAFALALLIGAVTHAHAQKGASAKNATTGMNKPVPARTVRDHRGPYGARSGGVSVRTSCTLRSLNAHSGPDPYCTIVRDQRRK